MSEKLTYPINPTQEEKTEAMTPVEHRIKSGNTEVVVSSTMAGLVTEFRVNGENILYEDRATYQDPNQMKIKAGIPVLFPYAGPRTDGIQHGGAREVPAWAWEESSEDSVTLSLKSEDIKGVTLPSMVPGEKVGVYEGKDASGNDILETLGKLYGEGYRFNLEMTITVREGVLRYDFKIKNLSERVVPFAPGLHPYFKCDCSRRSEIETNLDDFDLTKKDLNENPAKAHRPENGTVEFKLPSGIRVSIESSDEFRYFVGWASSLEDNYICIEPFAADPKNPEPDQIMIKPGEEVRLFVEFKIEN